MPQVSVIIPCFNEESTIAGVLQAVYAQDFPHADLEVVIADGLSTDGTRTAIAAFQTEHPDLSITVVDNPQRLIPAALNRAIAAARGEVILRLDAHCVPQPGYIARSLEALQAGRGWNVGGVWQVVPGGPGWMAAAIAAAAAHPLGVGDALYRYTTQAQEVDTVPFGAFRRALVAEIGGFDESLHSNEDYEFNTRIRAAGGKIWLDPQIKSLYYARSSLPALASQYARYGYWKLRMLRRYPGSLRWRQAIPPLFVLALLGLSLGGLWWPWLHKLLIAQVVSYVLLLLAAAAERAIRTRNIGLLFGMPLAIATMHISWGGAFLRSLLGALLGR
ncbi:MAG: glycosyltransferase family 2 protein [Anaerolineales bacterium]|nr:glycosyltransferase family 2 protein [Anaerolineales bacterium]MCW5854553.1 glycosyltransferase family 2 protein [Anaerolineales bacterium]